MTRLPAYLITIFLLAAASQLQAQATRQITNIDRRIETMNRQSREFERDNMGRDGKKSKEETAKRTREIRLEIEEDLKALQSAYNEIVLALQGDIKPGFAAETARSIAKNSERLKANLVLPAVDNIDPSVKPPVQVPEQERQALRALGKSVYDFVTNPIFEGTTALDVKESTRASRDLDAVIAISHAISSR